MSRAARLGALTLALGIIGISFSPIFVKLSEVGPTATAIYRMGFALPAMAAWMMLEARGPIAPKKLTGRDWWLLAPPNRTVVAVDDDGTILGTAKMNANQYGNGSHVASASYVVDPAHSGRGVGRALCEHTLDWARGAGFLAMQFNAVVETNLHAVKLYRSLGFEVLCTIPKGFRHPAAGYVGLHVMYLALV